MTGVLNQRDNQREKRREKREAQKPTNDNWKGFVNVELNTKEKEVVKAWRDDVAKLWGHLEGRIEDGYKVTFSIDTYNNAYVCGVTGRGKGDPNEGLTLTGRGGTLWGAVASFMYKDTVLLEGRWDSVAVQGKRVNDPDDVG